MSIIRAALRSALRQKPKQQSAHFSLKYQVPSGGEPITVGHLSYDSGAWSFEYDPAYRARADLRPIEGFDDLHRPYRSKVLFPFFAARVPALHRPDIREWFKQQHMADATTCDLLRKFGRRAAAAPAFELVETHSASG